MNKVDSKYMLEWFYFHDEATNRFIVTDNEKSSSECIPFGTNTIATVHRISTDPLDNEELAQRITQAPLLPEMVEVLKYAGKELRKIYAAFDAEGYKMNNPVDFDRLEALILKYEGGK